MKAIVLSLIVLALPVAAISTPCLKKGETALSGSIETYKKDPDSFTKTGKARCCSHKSHYNQFVDRDMTISAQFCD